MPILNLKHLYLVITLSLRLLTTAKFGVATNFSSVDPANPDPYAACLHRDLRDSDMVVAHRTLPCNSKVWIYAPRTRRSVVARVGDRGPRRALLDLNVAVTKALKANGKEAVVMVALPLTLPTKMYNSADP